MVIRSVTHFDDFAIFDRDTFSALADPIRVAGLIAACQALWGRAALLDALAVAMPRKDAEEALAALLTRGDVVALSAGVNATTILPARTVRLRLGNRVATCGLLLAETAETVPFDEALGPPDWRAASSASDLVALAAAPIEDGGDPLAGWRFIGGRGDPRMLLRWPEDAPISPPPQVARIMALFATVEADSADLADLADWAGLPVDPAGMDDPSQQAVAALPEHRRSIVTAGPGAGKTHTIRARLSALDAQGVSPARVLCIVYTRAAVRALSERCADLPAGARPQIRTLDSLAAEFAGIAHGDYEATVRAATAALMDLEGSAADYMAGREHLIIDEAQDIVGSRRVFLRAILAALDPECGVTVFGDPAQAIYDYDDPGAVPLHRVLVRDYEFAEHRLERNHRMPPGPLRDFAHETGHLLRDDSNDIPDAVATVRARIEDVAESGTDEGLASVRAPDLHLFRYGAEMASMALDLARGGIPCSIRGGTEGARPPVLAPAWLAPVAHALCNGSSIIDLPQILADVSSSPSADALSALFDPLRQQGGLTMGVLVRALENGSMPLLSPPAGAVALSTIHASKGLEADHVALYLPREHRPREGAAVTALEEARVLFVGASRARRKLSLRIVSRWMKSTYDKRYWHKEGNSAVVRISALDAPNTVLLPDRGPLYGPITDPHLIWQPEARRWLLHDAEGPLAQFSEHFAHAVSTIGNTDFHGQPFIPEARGWLRAHPATVAREGTLVVVPVLEGFVRIGFAGGRDT
jgi:hypothetical protein